jgi:hypothetical protein
MSDTEEIIGEEINGTWVMIDGEFKDTLTYNYIPNYSPIKGKDAFATNTQSGSADFRWYINGNMLITWYQMSDFKGDYESYMGIAEGDVFTNYVSISGNQLSITYDGTDLIYTKQE